MAAARTAAERCRTCGSRSRRPRGRWMLVDGVVSLQVGAGEVLGLVGRVRFGQEPDAALDRPSRAGRRCRSRGEVRWRGVNLLELPESRLNAVRGREIAVIFQEPMTALNPVLTVGDADRRERCARIADSTAAAAASAPSSCSTASAFRPRSAHRRLSRTSSPAACASA